ELTQLQVAIGEMLGGDAASFSPVAAWADPKPIVEQANRSAHVLRTGDKLRPRLRRHQQNASLLMPIVVAYGIGWAAVMLVVVKPLKWHWTRLHSLKTAGLWLCGASIVAALIVYAIYTYYESKLVKADELATGSA